MDWAAFTAVATMFTGVVIAVTAVVGIYQLRQLRQQRRDAAAIELMRSLQDTTFARAFLAVLSLPQGMAAAELRARGSQFEESAAIVEFRFETLGLLVYRDTIAFEVVSDLVGGAIIGVWNRLKDSVAQTRREQNWPGYCEWFQWLAERLEGKNRLAEIPAYARFHDTAVPSEVLTPASQA